MSIHRPSCNLCDFQDQQQKCLIQVHRTHISRTSSLPKGYAARNNWAQLLLQISNVRACCFLIKYDAIPFLLVNLTCCSRRFIWMTHFLSCVSIHWLFDTNIKLFVILLITLFLFLKSLCLLTMIVSVKCFWMVKEIISNLWRKTRNKVILQCLWIDCSRV